MHAPVHCLNANAHNFIYLQNLLQLSIQLLLSTYYETALILLYLSVDCQQSSTVREMNTLDKSTRKLHLNFRMIFCVSCQTDQNLFSTIHMVQVNFMIIYSEQLVRI